ncbi:hypothetical protein [Streptomyces xanthii]|uniref:hypothetical protein n=1 Tax=Streptomyces xanthii TaxID=2768069 RepID=UPI002948C1C0|nr:hypothetical protein [Streptomyces xanthii]
MDDTEKKRVRHALEAVGGIMMMQGVVGLIHAFTGRLTWGLIRHLGFLDGREVYGSITLIVLAVAVLAAAESRLGPRPDPEDPDREDPDPEGPGPKGSGPKGSDQQA